MTGSKRSMKYILIVIAAAMAAAVTLVFAVRRPATAETPEHQSHDDGGWTAWTNTADLPTNGKIYLTDDVTLSAAITLDGELTLCLNGRDISGTTTKFDVPTGTTLNICDCSDTPGSLTGATEGSAVVVSGGTFNLYSGSISGNGKDSSGNITAGYAGSGVYVEHNVTGGTFNMYGGEISNNGTNGDGGGVCVKGKNSTQKSTFNMYGGTIDGNRAASGGGVYLHYTDFIMDGGTISNNESTAPYTTATSAFNGGGGIYVGEQSTFTMDKNSVITKNTAELKGGGVNVHNPNGRFIMNGGTISDNKAAYGGGVFSRYEFTMNGGTISNNTATKHDGGVV